MADKRGPKRTVAHAVRVGEYGNTKWLVELVCGHTLETKRKPNATKDTFCCKDCISQETSPSLDLTMPGELWDYYDPVQELKIKAALATKVGVPLEQVEVINGTATVFLDAQQVKRLL